MIDLQKLVAAIVLATCAAFGSVPATAQSYTLNGQIPPSAVSSYMAAHGLPAGHYWLDQSGYWGMIGNSTPLGNIYAGTYSYRYGSGEQSSNGWSVRSGGFSVYGDSNGCLYAGDWSNC